MKHWYLSLLVASVLQASPTFALKRVSGKWVKPKLVVVIVIDQFRSDYLTRFSNRFLPVGSAGAQRGGFQYFLQNGAWIASGQYELLQNMTGPGHSTILSGSYPYTSGIPLNSWYDAKSGAEVYCAEDRLHKTVGAATSSPHIGTSPKNFIGTTVGDELRNSDPLSRVVSVALKDRSAIFMGGYRANLSVWWDSASAQWVSSDFYLPEGKLPSWIIKENQKNGKLTKEFLKGPGGVEKTLHLAENAVTEFKLGVDGHTDLLAIGISSHDYLGHEFGPNAPEMEAMTLAEDRLLGRFVGFLDKNVPGGLKAVTFVLTADHGIASVPEWLNEEKIPAARIDEPALLKRLNETVAAQWKPSSGNWFSHVSEMQFYLSPDAFKDKKVTPQEVRAFAKAALLNLSSDLSHVVTEDEVVEDRLPPGLLGSQVRKSFFKGRSGDLIALVKPNTISVEKGTNHQTGYAYDRTVPILFVGSAFQPGNYAGEANVVDIAPTLSFLLGIIAPAQSEGKIISEIFR